MNFPLDTNVMLDTNVVSELMRPSPSPLVRDWVRAQAPGELFTTAITVAEIRYGLERLADGRYLYRSGRFTADLAVDDDGMVLQYGVNWKVVATSGELG